MKRLLDDRLSRARRMADRLAADYPLTWDDVLAQSSDGENTVFGARILPMRWLPWVPPRTAPTRSTISCM